jgi:hypothetical protein
MTIEEVAVRRDRVLDTSLRDVRSESFASFVERSAR